MFFFLINFFYTFVILSTVEGEMEKIFNILI